LCFKFYVEEKNKQTKKQNPVDESHLFREPGTEERHVVSIGVRVDSAKRVSADDS
jgi:hypothetical protein